MQLNKKNITVLVVVFVAIITMLNPNRFIYIIDKAIDGFYSNQICINSHCFFKPNGWIDKQNSIRLMSQLTNSELPKSIDSFFMLRNINNEVVDIRSTVQNFDNLPNDVTTVRYKDLCTYAYRINKTTSQDILQVVIKEYNIELMLSNNNIIKDTMLNAICSLQNTPL